MAEAAASGGQDGTPFDFPTIRTQMKNQGPDIAYKLTALFGYFQQIGAQPAARRLRMLDSSYRTLTPDAIDRIANPDRALDEADEIERAQARKLHDWRNRLALGPLVLTWWALAWSTIAYQQQLTADPRLVTQPFLLLWQEGFGGRLFFLCPSFFWTALLDFLMLAGIVALTWRAQAADVRVTTAMTKLASDLDGVLGELGHALEDRIVPTDNPKNWVEAVRKVIDAAMRETKEMANANRLVLEQMQSALGRFETDGRQFIDDLARHQGKVISDASAQLQEMVKGTRSAQDHIAELNKQALNEATATMKTSRDEITAFIKSLADDSRVELKYLQDMAEENLKNSAREAADIIRTAGASMGELSVELPGYIKQLGTDVAAYSDSATKFADKVTELGGAAATLTASAQRFAQSGGSIDDTLKRLEQSQSANSQQIAGAADGVTRAAGALQTLTARLTDDLSPRLNEAATNAAVASRTLADVNSQMGPAAMTIAQAVQRFEKAREQGIHVSLLPKIWPFGHK